MYFCFNIYNKLKFLSFWKWVILYAKIQFFVNFSTNQISLFVMKMSCWIKQWTVPVCGSVVEKLFLKIKSSFCTRRKIFFSEEFLDIETGTWIVNKMDYKVAYFCKNIFWRRLSDIFWKFVLNFRAHKINIFSNKKSKC